MYLGLRRTQSRFEDHYRPLYFLLGALGRSSLMWLLLDLTLSENIIAGIVDRVSWLCVLTGTRNWTTKGIGHQSSKLIWFDVNPVDGSMHTRNSLYLLKSTWFWDYFKVWFLTNKTLIRKFNVLIFISDSKGSLLIGWESWLFPDLPVEMTYEEVKELRLRHLKIVTFEAGGRDTFCCLLRRDDQSIREFNLQLKTQAVCYNFGDQF